MISCDSFGGSEAVCIRHRGIRHWKCSGRICRKGIFWLTTHRVRL